MKKARKLLSAMLGVALALAQVPASVATAAWMPDHQIPAYQQKDIFATDTVKIQGLTVSEVVNATANPVITRSIDKEVKFVVFNSTKQVIEQEVTSKDGKLPDLNLVRNHNYIIWAEDSEYRMPNVYVWVKDGRLVDIKKNVDTGNYPEVDSLELYKRDQTVEKPEEEQRIRSNIKVCNQYGGALYNIKFKLVSNVETLEYSTGNSGKLTVDLLEDVIYMVMVDSPSYTVDSFPVVVKDKSEYGAGKYTYDFSSCAKVDDIKLMDKKDAHKYDSILTNTNYDTVYAGIYENIAGNTTITGMNFKDFLVLDRKLDKNTVQGMDGKDYDVFDIKVVNPHRWEIAYIAAGDYQVTEKLDNAKTVKNVYYVDDSRALQPVSFTQDGSNVTFSMNTLSMYPVVVEYGSQELEADNTVLKVKVVDEKGNPVSGVKLYLKSQEYGTRGDLTIDDVTDASGKLGYHCTGDELNDDTYELLPTSDSGYECITSHEIVFDEDDEMHVDTVDDKVYQGEEVELVVKKIGGSEPEEPKPEVDKTTLKIKVVDEKGNPVSGVKLYLKSQEYGTRGDLTIDDVTDASGKLGYHCTGDELNDDTYELLPTSDSGYECITSHEIVFDEDDEMHVDTVDDKVYQGEEVELVVKKIGGSEPEEPKPEVDKTTLKIKVVDEKGNPVSGVKLYLKSQEYGSFGDLTIDDVTDVSGRVSYEYSGNELGDDTYDLVPTSDSGYEIVTARKITFDEDEECIATVDDKAYQGEEVELVVKKIGGSEPEEPKPEIDKTTLNIKVVNEKQKPVSDLQLSIKEGDSITPLAVVTDASGNVSYVSESAGTFTIQPDEESGYTCAAPIEIVTAQNENGQGFYIQKVNGQDFDGKDATLVVNKVETMVNEVQVSDSEIGSEGGEVTVTVRGTALPDKMYYAIYYIKQGVHGEEERVAVEAQEVETQGSSTEKTMKITLPKAEQYSGVLRWRVGVTDTNPEEGYYFASQQISIKAETPEPEKPGSDDKGDSKDDNKKDNQDDKGNNNQGNNQGDNGSNKADKGNANKDGGKDKNPQTGDSSTALPLSVSLIASFMVVCAIVLKKRNYKK